ncbi:hypothetical protein [Paenibacillus hamazuiensis]|uniref:hypothetical protein n=1 Tax=Paenibacillus hamazuiensis TaxID=2936508 RepID=UPI00200C20FC|nr:hypothetical protein [Paenibacillus hamazuiensis]
MDDNNQSHNGADTSKADVDQNAFQGAASYVQRAVEHAADTTADATQNLVNQVMNDGEDSDS